MVNTGIYASKRRQILVSLVYAINWVILYLIQASIVTGPYDQ